jgi:hypothetical protein
VYELGTRERQAIGKEFVEIFFYTSYPEDIMDMRSFDRREFRAATQHHGNWHAADWTSNAADWTPIGCGR